MYCAFQHADLVRLPYIKAIVKLCVGLYKREWNQGKSPFHFSCTLYLIGLLTISLAWVTDSRKHGLISLGLSSNFNLREHRCAVSAHASPITVSPSAPVIFFLREAAWLRDADLSCLLCRISSVLYSYQKALSEGADKMGLNMSSSLTAGFLSGAAAMQWLQWLRV